MTIAEFCATHSTTKDERADLAHHLAAYRYRKTLEAWGIVKTEYRMKEQNHDQ